MCDYTYAKNNENKIKLNSLKIKAMCEYLIKEKTIEADENGYYNCP